MTYNQNYCHENNNNEGEISMKTILKTMAILIGVFVLLMFTMTGCAAKKEAAPAVGMPNPMTEVTAEELTQKTGVALYAPDGASDVKFFTIATTNPLAEVTFQLNGKTYCHRAVAVEMDVTALSGIYFGKAAESDAKVAYCEAKLLTEGKTAVLYWFDKVPGITYTLSCTDCDDPNVLQAIAEEIFVPAQGEVG